MRNIFVDGYNVINAWPQLRDIMKYNLDSARQQLIETLQNYSSYKGHKIIVVFDAHMRKGSLEKSEDHSGVKVIYTKEGETADSYIEKMVNNIGRKVEVLVVTSDLLEQQLAFQRGAIRMSSTEFYFEVKSIEEKIKIKTEKKISLKTNRIEDRIDKEVLEKLEEIRRNR